MTIHLSGLAALRRQLVSAKADMAAAKDAEKSARALAERDAIQSANGSAGKNAEERERFLVLALAGDADYQRSLKWLRSAETAVLKAETEIEILLDARRAEEWQIRAALVERLQTSDPQAEPVDEWTEWQADALVDHLAGAATRRGEDLPF